MASNYTNKDSSQLAPNIKKLSELEATLFPVFKNVIGNEQAVSFLPKGHPLGSGIDRP